MIYVFRPTSSTSARDLAIAVDGLRYKTEDRLRRRLRTTDKVIMWGAYLPNLNGIVINNVPLRNKFEDALLLKDAGVRTVEVSRTRPAPPAPAIDPLIVLWDTAQDEAEAFARLNLTRNTVAREGVQELATKLNRVFEAMGVPAPAPPQVMGEWLARRFNHVGGDDLRAALTTGDYYSKKEEFVKEYRVHSFLGRSIRAGKKIPRTPQSDTPFTGTPHQWIRSFDSGWQINYGDDAGIKQAQRNIAHAAVKAVDIGEKADGTLVVLEVNRAAGVEGGTTEAYARAIRRWTSGEWTAANAEGN